MDSKFAEPVSARKRCISICNREALMFYWIMAISGLIFVIGLMLYASLVVASRADDYIEEMGDDGK